ncbi:SURF1 family protein [Aestuariivirga sp.]|uniref:SURF1 family protein n=1 Tax=Aestuariivirga sp. TaxID=2650926 RepID=UPI0039E70069
MSSPAPMREQGVRHRVWPVLLAAGIGLAILLALGTWQVKRLAWKEGLIAAIDRAIAADPVSLTDALAKPDPDFTKVTVTGAFSGPGLRRLAVVNGGPGWEVVQGFVTTDGARLLVSRGLIPEAAAIPQSPAEVTTTGILRRHGARGTYDGDNDVAGNRWYWWDVPAMQQAVFGGQGLATPLVLHLLPKADGTAGLTVEPPKADLRNNHLGYAITWFGLAAALVVVTGVFLRRNAMAR